METNPEAYVGLIAKISTLHPVAQVVSVIVIGVIIVAFIWMIKNVLISIFG